MQTARHRHQTITDEIRSIRAELRQLAASLHPQSDIYQRSVIDKNITELEKRIDELEARQQKRFSLNV